MYSSLSEHRIEFLEDILIDQDNEPVLFSDIMDYLIGSYYLYLPKDELTAWLCEHDEFIVFGSHPNKRFFLRNHPEGATVDQYRINLIVSSLRNSENKMMLLSQIGDLLVSRNLRLRSGKLIDWLQNQRQFIISDTNRKYCFLEPNQERIKLIEDAWRKNQKRPVLLSKIGVLFRDHQVQLYRGKLIDWLCARDEFVIHGTNPKYCSLRVTDQDRIDLIKAALHDKENDRIALSEIGTLLKRHYHQLEGGKLIDWLRDQEEFVVSGTNPKYCSLRAECRDCVGVCVEIPVTSDSRTDSYSLEAHDDSSAEDYVSLPSPLNSIFDDYPSLFRGYHRVELIDCTDHGAVDSAVERIYGDPLYSDHFEDRIKFICVDLEGVNLGKNGEITLIQIATAHHLYAFDVIGCIEKDYRGPPRIDLPFSLEYLLGSPSLVKVLHALRGDSAALSHQCGIELYPVMDTQIAFMDIEESKHPRSLTKLLKHYSLGNERFFTLQNTISKKIGRTPWDPIWLRRPISPLHFAYALSDVVFLGALMNKLLADLSRKSTDYHCILMEKSHKVVLHHSRLRGSNG